MACPAPEININKNRGREIIQENCPLLLPGQKKIQRAITRRKNETSNTVPGPFAGNPAVPATTPPEKGIRTRNTGNFRKSYMIPRKVLYRIHAPNAKISAFLSFFFEPFGVVDSFIY
jgi:hypothetical protein